MDEWEKTIKELKSSSKQHNHDSKYEELERRILEYRREDTLERQRDLEHLRKMIIYGSFGLEGRMENYRSGSSHEG